MLNFAATYYANFVKVSLKNLKKRAWRQFSETNPSKITSSQILNVAKSSKIRMFCKFLLNFTVFDVLNHYRHIWMEFMIYI